ncbi:hypothetical protein [Kitasatospora xanthocidica]|uniref:hypothetical protein n=1 Tax=Kitasatospora xanthocidica TaxID=83382 RepID=UPI00167B71AF|nr:hypothetical protein [Kitasatospora xanthocidica]
MSIGPTRPNTAPARATKGPRATPETVLIPRDGDSSPIVTRIVEGVVALGAAALETAGRLGLAKIEARKEADAKERETRLRLAQIDADTRRFESEQKTEQERERTKQEELRLRQEELRGGLRGPDAEES